MIGLGAAMLGSAAIRAGSSYLGASDAAKKNKEAGQIAAQGARDASKAQIAGIDTGIGELRAGVGDMRESYAAGRNYLDPYATNRDPYNFLTGGYGTPDQQASSLATWQGSPDYNILQQARKKAIEEHLGSGAAAGMRGSGPLLRSLTEATGKMDLDAYYKFKNAAEVSSNIGYNAALQQGASYQNEGNQLANAGIQLNNAYGQRGTADASGYVGSANALAGAKTNSGNIWNQFYGDSGNAAQNVLGYASGANNFFGPGGSNTTPGTQFNGGWTTNTSSAPMNYFNLFR